MNYIKYALCLHQKQMQAWNLDLKMFIIQCPKHGPILNTNRDIDSIETNICSPLQTKTTKQLELTKVSILVVFHRIPNVRVCIYIYIVPQFFHSKYIQISGIHTLVSLWVFLISEPLDQFKQIWHLRELIFLLGHLSHLGDLTNLNLIHPRRLCVKSFTYNV